MALTTEDKEQLKLIIAAALSGVSGDMRSVEQKVDGLKDLFIEKLNGHGSDVERHGKQIDHLYQLDRDRVDDLGRIRADLEKVKGKVEGNREVADLQETGRDKVETAVESVKSGITAKHLAWVGVASGIVGVLLSAVLAWLMG